MSTPAHKLLTPNSVTLIKIPESLYKLIDFDHIGHEAPSTVLGNVIIRDENHIGIEIDKNQYYGVKDGPSPDSVQTSFTAKIIDATHRDLFMFTENNDGKF